LASKVCFIGAFEEIGKLLWGLFDTVLFRGFTPCSWFGKASWFLLKGSLFGGAFLFWFPRYLENPWDCRSKLLAFELELEFELEFELELELELELEFEFEFEFEFELELVVGLDTAAVEFEDIDESIATGFVGAKVVFKAGFRSMAEFAGLEVFAIRFTDIVCKCGVADESIFDEDEGAVISVFGLE